MDYQKIEDWQKLKELKNLLDLANPPKQLYFQGNWNREIFKNCVAVVGSRKMTDYGERVVEKIIPRLINQNQTVVSGFMYGVDQYAHRVCVDSGGKTIAVLGWGIDKKLTSLDAKLAKDIVDSGGLLLSEWESQEGTLWTFPLRNRIVAALCDEVIVVEAAENSGSLITARAAARLKKTVWAVPGPITSKTSRGTNRLIAEAKAKMWLGEDSMQLSLSPNIDPLLQILENEALTADELARKLKTAVSEIGAKLSLLLISGQIMEKGGKYYLTDAS
ncbi:DNA-protecting protein DprA [Candidatus Daviesbacteria bacterium]|nr:DNA-protecting protein DprA [Candidatus Daviesbacteria bacterium]